MAQDVKYPIPYRWQLRGLKLGSVERNILLNAPAWADGGLTFSDLTLWIKRTQYAESVYDVNPWYRSTRVSPPDFPPLHWPGCTNSTRASRSRAASKLYGAGLVHKVRVYSNRRFSTAIYLTELGEFVVGRWWTHLQNGKPIRWTRLPKDPGPRPPIELPPPPPPREPSGQTSEWRAAEDIRLTRIWLQSTADGSFDPPELPENTPETEIRYTGDVPYTLAVYAKFMGWSIPQAGRALAMAAL